MNILKTSLKKIVLQNLAHFKNAIHSYIKPFQEMPSNDLKEHEDSGRINAHDLFSHYTADIIKEDVVFIR